MEKCVKPQALLSDVLQVTEFQITKKDQTVELFESRK